MTLKKVLIPFAALATLFLLSSCATKTRSVAQDSSKYPEQENAFSKTPGYPKHLFNNDHF